MRGPVDKHIAAALESIAAQREEVIVAFIAKYGFEPDRTVQVIEHSLGGPTRWYLRRMTDEEMQQASMDGAAL